MNWNCLLHHKILKMLFIKRLVLLALFHFCIFSREQFNRLINKKQSHFLHSIKYIWLFNTICLHFQNTNDPYNEINFMWNVWNRFIISLNLIDSVKLNRVVKVLQIAKMRCAFTCLNVNYIVAHVYSMAWVIH